MCCGASTDDLLALMAVLYSVGWTYQCLLTIHLEQGTQAVGSWGLLCRKLLGGINPAQIFAWM